MPVLYNGKKMIPAPLITIEKVFQKTNDGQIVGAFFSLTVQGTMLAYKGSPTGSGTFWTAAGYPPDETVSDVNRLEANLAKEEALRGLFATQNQLFQIMPLDESGPTYCYPRINKITFPEGNWYNDAKYTIELEADKLYGPLFPSGEDSFAENISQATDNWQIEFNDAAEDVNQQQTFRLTHTVSAVGKPFYSSGGVPSTSWMEARDWVLPRLGIDSARVTASGVLNLPAYMGGFNHVRSEQVDKLDGNYSVIETWLVASGSALEDFTVNTTIGSDDGLDHVSIAGTVTGLDTRDANFQITTTKYAAAATKFNTVEGLLFSRAQTYSALSLNSEPKIKTVGRNPVVGSINYSYDYDNRPSKVITNSKSETITITETHPTDIFAAIAVLGRKAGPVLQDIGASGVNRRSLSIEAVMQPASGSTYSAWMTAKPNTNALVAMVKPAGTQVFKEQDDEVWTFTHGRYSRNVAWTFEE